MISGENWNPEFPSTIITSLFMILSVLGLAFTRRFRRKLELCFVASLFKVILASRPFCAELSQTNS
jgi:hypothetical protein